MSLFVGRVEDFGLSNREAIVQMMLCIDEMKSPTKLIAASIRNPEYLIEAVMNGAHVLTVPPSCWEKVYHNPLFYLGEKEFLESWTTLPKELRFKYEQLD